MFGRIDGKQKEKQTYGSRKARRGTCSRNAPVEFPTCPAPSSSPLQSKADAKLNPYIQAPSGAEGRSSNHRAPLDPLVPQLPTATWPTDRPPPQVPTD